MSKRIVLIVLATLTLIATGCKKGEKQPASDDSAKISITVTGAPESAVLVGEIFPLNVEITPKDAEVETVVWSSSNPAVAKVNAGGNVLATGKGTCEISATVGKASGKVAVSVDDRDPVKDEMGHTGNGKTLTGMNNNEVYFPISGTRWTGNLWYQGGNNSMTYYNNGTFKADWSATNNLVASIGYDYGNPVKWQDMDFDCYFKHSKTGTAGGYSFIGIHGWTLNPLVEFYIVDDWFSKPGPQLLGQKKGEFVVDGDSYDIYQNKRVNAPSISGEKTFSQFYSVRSTARPSGHIDISAHFKEWESLGMKMGDDMRQLMYYLEVGGGSGSMDCTYLYMCDGQL